MGEDKVVLVLDASLTTRKIIEVILHREGYQVIGFENPREALHYLAQHRQQLPDLVFVGLRLPGVDGYRVLQYLKGEPCYRTIVTIALLTQADGPLGHLKARLAGARQTMFKPLVRQRIVALVAEHIGHAAR